MEFYPYEKSDVSMTGSHQRPGRLTHRAENFELAGLCVGCANQYARAQLTNPRAVSHTRRSPFPLCASPLCVRVHSLLKAPFGNEHSAEPARAALRHSTVLFRALAVVWRPRHAAFGNDAVHITYVQPVAVPRFVEDGCGWCRNSVHRTLLEPDLTTPLAAPDSMRRAPKFGGRSSGGLMAHTAQNPITAATTPGPTSPSFGSPFGASMSLPSARGKLRGDSVRPLPTHHHHPHMVLAPQLWAVGEHHVAARRQPCAPLTAVAWFVDCGAFYSGGGSI